MDSLLEKCTCLVCGDMYTDPKSLVCGHTFCRQCLLERNGPVECPDPDCRMETVPGRERVDRLQTNAEMVGRIKALVREGNSHWYWHNTKVCSMSDTTATIPNHNLWLVRILGPYNIVSSSITDLAGNFNCSRPNIPFYLYKFTWERPIIDTLHQCCVNQFIKKSRWE